MTFKQRSDKVNATISKYVLFAFFALSITLIVTI
jgi:hypothetical protein